MFFFSLLRTEESRRGRRFTAIKRDCRVRSVLSPVHSVGSESQTLAEWIKQKSLTVLCVCCYCCLVRLIGLLHAPVISHHKVLFIKKWRFKWKDMILPSTCWMPHHLHPHCVDEWWNILSWTHKCLRFCVPIHLLSMDICSSRIIYIRSIIPFSHEARFPAFSPSNKNKLNTQTTAAYTNKYRQRLLICPGVKEYKTG